MRKKAAITLTVNNMEEKKLRIKKYELRNKQPHALSIFLIHTS
jgi:hypothetical protein